MAEPEDSLPLPALPVQGQNPYFEPRNAWDEEVQRRLEGYLSPDGLSSTIDAAVTASVGGIVGGLALATIGNSIEEGGTNNGTQVLGAKSYVNALAMRSAGRLRLVRNAGISGETTAQMLARFDTDITPWNPSVVLLGSGENDLKAEFGLTPAQVVEGVAALVAKTRSIGALPVVHTTVPRPSATVTLAALTEFNWRLTRWAQDNGVPLLDFYGLLVSATDGSLYANSAYHSDGTHPTSRGAMVMADYAYATLLPYLPPGETFLARSNNDPYNLVTNGLMIVDSNADGTPDNWTATNTTDVARSLETVAGVPGKMFQMDRTAGASRATITQSVAASGKFSSGQRLAIGYRFQAEGDTATYNGFYGIFTGASGSQSFKSFDLGVGPITDGVGYQEFTVPAGTTSIDLYAASDPGVGKVRVGQVTLRNLTARGLA